jgi:hypothetical protein
MVPQMESGMESWMRFALALLATWRVTHLLADEDGPGDLIVRLRGLLGDSLAGKLMDCFYCLSLWIAAPAALFLTRRPLDWLMAWLAISGGACLLEQWTKHPETAQAVSREGEDHHVLRLETGTDEEHPDRGHPTEEQRSGGNSAGKPDFSNRTRQE